MIAYTIAVHDAQLRRPGCIWVGLTVVALTRFGRLRKAALAEAHSFIVAHDCYGVRRQGLDDPAKRIACSTSLPARQALGDDARAGRGFAQEPESAYRSIIVQGNDSLEHTLCRSELTGAAHRYRAVRTSFSKHGQPYAAPSTPVKALSYPARLTTCLSQSQLHSLPLS
jgi:hypothetical protein